MGYKDRDILVQTSLYDRVSKLLESFEFSDCSFSVSGQHFKAHKLILSISSPVFKAMFYGPLCSNKDIIVSDIEPDIFQLLINYIYTDKVQLSCIEQAFELLYASKKYLLEFLTEKCIDYIEENLSADNVIQILNFSEYVQEKRLLVLCLQLLAEHAHYILSDNAEMLASASLKLILDCELINITERDLIKFVFQWTNNYCRANDIPVTVKNRRDVLIDNGMFGKLRFLSLSRNDFDSIMQSDNVVLPEEAKFISKYLLNKETNLQSFNEPNIEESGSDKLTKNSKCRNNLSIKWCVCHRSSFRSTKPLVVDSINNQVNVRVRGNKTVFINSLCIPTRMSPLVNFHNEGALKYSEQLTVSIVRQSDNCMIKSLNFMNTVEYDSLTFIQFSEPLVFKMDEWYNISFKWPLNRTYSYKYIVSNRTCVVRNKVKFEFEDVINNNSTGGSFLECFNYSL